MNRVIFLAVICTLLTACIPLPHTYQDLPAVRGVVTESDRPVSGVRLHLADITRTNPCEKGEQSTVTDASGAFTIAGRRRVALFASILPGHGTDTWAIALFANDQPLGYVRPWNYRAGPRYAPREVELQCRLDDRTCTITDHTWNRTKTLTLSPCAEFSPDAYSH